MSRSSNKDYAIEKIKETRRAILWSIARGPLVLLVVISLCVLSGFLAVSAVQSGMVAQVTGRVFQPTPTVAPATATAWIVTITTTPTLPAPTATVKPTVTITPSTTNTSSPTPTVSVTASATATSTSPVPTASATATVTPEPTAPKETLIVQRSELLVLDLDQRMIGVSYKVSNSGEHPETVLIRCTRRKHVTSVHFVSRDDQGLELRQELLSEAWFELLPPDTLMQPGQMITVEFIIAHDTELQPDSTSLLDPIKFTIDFARADARIFATKIEVIERLP